MQESYRSYADKEVVRAAALLGWLYVGGRAGWLACGLVRMVGLVQSVNPLSAAAQHSPPAPPPCCPASALLINNLATPPPPPPPPHHITGGDGHGCGHQDAVGHQVPLRWGVLHVPHPQGGGGGRCVGSLAAWVSVWGVGWLAAGVGGWGLG